MTDSGTSSAPTVSVVIPVHNHADRIANAVRSVLHQEFDNLDVIVVDDGSDDDPASKLQEFLGEIRILKQRCSGPGAARNRGIDLARGTYIAFLDADDDWLPSKLSTLVNFLEDHPEIQWASSNHWVIPREAERRLKLPVRGDPGAPRVGLVTDWFSSYGLHVATTTSGVVVRKSVLAETGGFDEHARSGQDYDLWFRIAIRYPSLGYCAEPLFNYWEHIPGSITSAGPSIYEDKYLLLGRHVDWEVDRNVRDTRHQRVINQSLKFVRRCISAGRRDLAVNMIARMRHLIPASKVLFWLIAAACPPRAAKVLGRLRGWQPRNQLPDSSDSPGNDWPEETFQPIKHRASKSTGPERDD